jgi:murein DD-endopeptidase MepM/ murein hydrolase activator NlpD
LKPYATATRIILPTSTANVAEIPLPSPTPSTYRVESGDSLGTIAEQFGLSLAELQAANPGVVSESLRVGQKINIPVILSGDNAPPLPAPADVSAVRCYPAGAGTYCLAQIHNPFAENLENVTLQMTVLDDKGRVQDRQEAFLPLNVLPPGGTLPAYTLFADLPAGTLPIAQLSSSIRLSAADRRYLPAVIQNTLVSINWDSRSARVQGQVFLPALGKNPPSATGIWLAGIAYDAEGQIIGFRRWEWQGTLKPGNAQGFDFSVYSLGPAIETVDVVVEARP